MRLKTIALNINNFAGKKTKPVCSDPDYQKKISEYNLNDNIVKRKIRAKEIANWLIHQHGDANLIVLSEFENGTIIGDAFEEAIKDDFYVLKPKHTTKNVGSWSIVVVLVSKRVSREAYTQKTSPVALIPWARWLEVEVTLGEKIISILGIHASNNRGRDSFKSALEHYARNKKNDHSIIIGDFNAAINEDRAKPSKASVENGLFLDSIKTSGFTDTWRINNKREKIFSWYYNCDMSDGRRLDYAFVSRQVNDCFHCDVAYKNAQCINGSHLSDHSAVILECVKKQ